jgi:hypothetical protein
MAKPAKQQFLEKLKGQFGPVRKLPNSQSLFAIGDNAAMIYVRYSKVHPGGRTFFGLRSVDLLRLEGHNSFICFLLDDESPPLFLPYADFEEVFRAASAASDGQYKVQLLGDSDCRELYVARSGKFNVEGYVGFQTLTDSIGALTQRPYAHELTHCQVQTLVASIGHAKGYDVFVPPRDVIQLDWKLAIQFEIQDDVPKGFDEAERILREIDVIWMTPGRNEVQGLFEVEHTTTIYSGLLRFNDALLTAPNISRFVVVSNESRRSIFARQVFRPTFRRSGLSELASFLDYANVFNWHARCTRSGTDGSG